MKNKKDPRTRNQEERMGYNIVGGYGNTRRGDGLRAAVVVIEGGTARKRMWVDGSAERGRWCNRGTDAMR